MASIGLSNANVTKKALPEGGTRKSLAIAKNILSMGMLPEQMAKGTQLPLEIVLSLAGKA